MQSAVSKVVIFLNHVNVWKQVPLNQLKSNCRKLYFFKLNSNITEAFQRKLTPIDIQKNILNWQKQPFTKK